MGCERCTAERCAERVDGSEWVEYRPTDTKGGPMIYAKTGMERMPENCGECELLGEGQRCRIGHADCPLTEIDETLPAQDDRLGNGG